MAESRWYLSVDGQQEGDFALDEVRAKVQKNQGRRVLVWTQGMSQWADPAELPQFKVAPAPAPAPAPSVIPAPVPGPVTADEQPISAKIDKAEIKKQAGILKSLLDFRFEHFVTGKIIPVVYVIVMIVIALGVVIAIIGGGFVGLVDAFRFTGFRGAVRAIGIILLSPLVGILYLALFRISFEFLIIIFRMKQDLTTLVERTELKEEKEAKK